MKYAYLEVQGYQIRAEEGEKILVPRLHAQEGEELTLDRVLYVRDEDQVFVGTPFVEGATVKAKVLGEQKLPKIIVFKYKRRKKYRRKKGHRQRMTELLIEEIQTPGA